MSTITHTTSQFYVVHKFQMDLSQVELPEGRVLHVAPQHGRPTVWLERPLIDGKPDDTSVQTLTIVGTGNPFNRERLGEFLQTFLTEHGEFVFHAYVRGGVA